MYLIIGVYNTKTESFFLALWIWLVKMLASFPSQNFVQYANHTRLVPYKLVKNL